MNASLVDTLYVSAVPPWLTQQVDSGRLTLKDLESFSRLASILSERDVSFYCIYAKRLLALTDGVYDGMKNIVNHPDNIQWANEHAELLKECEDSVDLSNFMSTVGAGDLEPSDIRRAFYEPRALGSTTLFLLGRSKSIYVTYVDYFSAAMSELSRMVGYDQAVNSRVLDAFIVANQKLSTV